MRRSPARPSRAAQPPPDRHRLYELAVQDPGAELDLVERTLRRSGRHPRRLREDFSGTALLAATWVARGPRREAVAVDRDRSVHDWARRHRLPGLPGAERLRLATADVRRAPRGPFDAIVALNFSWQAFRERAALRSYFAAALRSLAPGGVLVLDLFGGWLAQQTRTERRRLPGGVTYVWEHESYDPISGRIRCAIHFELKDGRTLRRAFTYDWRLWTLPEVTQMLAEVGFDPVEVLWDVAPEGHTRYLPRRRAENQPGWMAQVVGRRPRRRARGRRPAARARRGLVRVRVVASPPRAP